MRDELSTFKVAEFYDPRHEFRLYQDGELVGLFSTEEAARAEQKLRIEKGMSNED